MLAKINHLINYFGFFYQDIIVSVVIMVSAIIFVIGLLKPIIFDKIRNKDLRKCALALANIAGCFVASMFYFLKNGWDFKYYTVASLALTIASIVIYYLYETIPYVRKVIGGIGYSAISKVFNVGILAVTTDDAETVKKEVKKTETELKATTKSELKKQVNKITTDKDLTNL